MRLIDADRALESVRDPGIAHPNAYHLTNYATLILREAPTITDLSKCMAFNSEANDKPQTNADRIRAMSDEELAKILGGKCICPPTSGCAEVCGDCVACWLEWLQKPAENQKEV